MKAALALILLLVPVMSRAESFVGVSASTVPAAARPSALDSASDPRIAKVKAEIRETLLEVRRARYALRKAEGARDPAAVEAARARLDEAKAGLKALRTKLRELLAPGGAGKAKKSRKAGGASR
ncbi:MAG: hypothetical protein WC969_06200 [Elusimicrobiota bacterium]|jgi:hypothetical protein